MRLTEKQQRELHLLLRQEVAPACFALANELTASIGARFATELIAKQELIAERRKYLQPGGYRQCD